MFIQTENTPNPDVQKFRPGQTVLDGRTLEFTTAQDAARAPLAQALFKVSGVVRVFLGPDFISVTKSKDATWETLNAQILSVIMDHFLSGLPVVEEDTEDTSTQHIQDNSDDALVVQIKELLETRVRPAVAMDGGDVAFDRFEDGIVYLHMQGACAGCPSAAMTLKMGIENMLKHFIPEVEEVRPVQ